MPVLYTFEAKSIQAYILDSSKLRDMVGASEQVENITAGLLDNVLKKLNLTENKNIHFSRKAGGAFIAIVDSLENANNLRDLWTFTVRYHLPGLEFVQGLEEYQHDRDIFVAEKAISTQKLADRNRLFPVFPIAGPLVARAPRTGAAAITTRPTPRNTERLDKRTLLKRRFLENAKSSALENKLKLDSEQPVIWPTDLEPEDSQTPEQAFPFLGENRSVAVIHANGNGLGKLLMNVREAIKKKPQNYAKVFKALSETIEKATIAATRLAAQRVLLPKAKNGKIMPARPLVLGGNDLTIIVRADLAIAFTQEFLEAFEIHSEKLLAKLKQDYKLEKLPQGLTACAGIAFIKASQPFYLAYHLAESLCKTAKTRSKQNLSMDKRVPASLAFHRITTSVIDDYDAICKAELTTPAGWLVSMQPYAVGKIQNASGFPRLESLDKLRKVFAENKVSQGAIRELLSLLYLSPVRAERAYERWRENMGKKQKQGLKAIESCFKDIIGEVDQNLPILTVEKIKRSPLGDALTFHKATQAG